MRSSANELRFPFHHTLDSDILNYWAFDGAIELGNVSRKVHEILHVWGLNHDNSSGVGMSPSAVVPVYNVWQPFSVWVTAGIFLSI